MTETIVVEHPVNFVWIIRIDRPHRLNSLDPDSIASLRRELIAFREDSAARVAIITGTGDRGFCTGADLRETLPPSLPFAASAFMPDDESIGAGNYIRGLDLERLRIGKPLIAALNGHAVAGGMEIAMACDIRIAAENATLGLPEVKVGSVPAIGGIQRLMRSIPHSVALEMILTGDPIPARRAFELGLISKVVPNTDLIPAALDLASRIAANAPLAVKAARMLALEGVEMALPHALLLEQFVWGTLRDTKDRVEGRVAFAEKRPPVFEGR